MSSEEEVAEEFMSDGEAELHYSLEGLGQFHEIDGESVFVKCQDSLSCLRDVLRAIRRSNESAEEVDRDRKVELRLADWETVPRRLVPLFLFYREDTEIVEAVLKILVILTRPLSRETLHFARLLKYLQDYKQLLSDENVMVVLMALLMDAVKLQEASEISVTAELRATAMRRVELVLALVKNLLVIPDARTADAGYVPGREQLGLTLLAKLQTEGILDLFVLFSETTTNFWLMLEIYYGAISQVHPSDLVEGTKQRKPNLSRLLEQSLSLQRADVPLVFRHSRFGPQLSTGRSSRTAQQPPARNRQYDRNRVQGERLNVFQDRAFTDLLAGGTAGGPAGGATNGGEFLVEMRRFFELFIESSLNHVLAGAVKELLGAVGNEGFTDYDYVRTLNVIAWTLEFQRASHRSQNAVVLGELSAEPGGGGDRSGSVVVSVDITAVQWCVNEQAVALVLRQLKKHSKEAKSIKFGGAMVVVCLRALVEQLRMVGVLAKHKMHKELQDVAHEIFTNIMYEDVGNLLLWIVKNYAVTAHDPRVLSLAIDCLVVLIKDMELVEKIAGSNYYVSAKTKSKSKKKKKKTHKSGVGAGHTARVKTAAPTVPGEDSSDSDAASIRTSDEESRPHVEYGIQASLFSADGLVLGLTHKDALKPMISLVSKFRDNGKQLNSSLAFLFFRVLRLREEAVAIFFQLSTLVIFRDFLAAPDHRVVTAESPNYSDLLAVVKEIVRRFFLALQRGDALMRSAGIANELMPIEILFPRTFNELELKGLVSHYSDPAVRDWLVQEISGGASDEGERERDAETDQVAEILRVFAELKTSANGGESTALDRREFHRVVKMVADVLDIDDTDEIRVVLARHGIVPTEAPAAAASASREADADAADQDAPRDWRGVVFGEEKKVKGRKLVKQLVGLLKTSLNEDQHKFTETELSLLGSAVVAKYRL